MVGLWLGQSESYIARLHLLSQAILRTCINSLTRALGLKTSSSVLNHTHARLAEDYMFDMRGTCPFLSSMFDRSMQMASIHHDTLPCAAKVNDAYPHVFA
jgi:hypothetical protein